MKLVTKNERIYTDKGKYICSISMTDRAKELLDDDGWDKDKESWLEYRTNTKTERDLEKIKQYQLARDIADAYNNK